MSIAAAMTVDKVSGLISSKNLAKSFKVLPLPTIGKLPQSERTGLGELSGFQNFMEIILKSKFDLFGGSLDKVTDYTDYV